MMKLGEERQQADAAADKQLFYSHGDDHDEKIWFWFKLQNSNRSDVTGKHV